MAIWEQFFQTAHAEQRQARHLSSTGLIVRKPNACSDGCRAQASHPISNNFFSYRKRKRHPEVAWVIDPLIDGRCSVRNCAPCRLMKTVLYRCAIRLELADTVFTPSMPRRPAGSSTG